ncbi:MAG: helix-turn-helix transcriptional regulator [Desulfarculaceae bacterium]|nr:helix-turn-helix transcriptional regulator [Desulfarculaceae bacterium]
MTELLSTREVARFLKINEKMVYTLVNEKGLPATKVTGKWLFPLDLVKQWVEAGTVNYPDAMHRLPPYHGLVLICGSNDLLLDQVVSTFNSRFENHLAMFGFAGSMGGIMALKQNLCHMASSHLVSEDREYNFPFISEKMNQMPPVVNFCMREQGIITAKGNPLNIRSVADLAEGRAVFANRGLSTGTRALFDRELKKAGIEPGRIKGYENVVSKHLDAGFEILSGRADAAFCIKPVAAMLGLDFVSVCSERFDLLISKDRFFDKGIQLFLGLMNEDEFRRAAEKLGGYDLSRSGEMLYPEKEESSESE